MVISDSAIMDIMQQPGISPDVGINTAMLLSKNDRYTGRLLLYLEYA